jgi:hypothetical protein
MKMMINEEKILKMIRSDEEFIEEDFRIKKESEENILKMISSERRIHRRRIKDKRKSLVDDEYLLYEEKILKMIRSDVEFIEED